MRIALNNIRSLHNVGSIFRSADGAGAEEVILGGLTPVPPRTEIEKAALGATASIPWVYAANLHAFLLERKQQGQVLCALELTPDSTSLFESKLPKNAIIIVGHEREGVEPEILKICDYHFAIPMLGQSAKSLNVSNAAAIALYAFRQSAV